MARGFPWTLRSQRIREGRLGAAGSGGERAQGGRGEAAPSAGRLCHAGLSAPARVCEPRPNSRAATYTLSDAGHSSLRGRVLSSLLPPSDMNSARRIQTIASLIFGFLFAETSVPWVAVCVGQGCGVRGGERQKGANNDEPFRGTCGVPSPFRWKYPESSSLGLQGSGGASARSDPLHHGREGRGQGGDRGHPQAERLAAPTPRELEPCSATPQPLGHRARPRLPPETHRVTPLHRENGQGHFPSIWNVPGVLFPSRRTTASFSKFG